MERILALGTEDYEGGDPSVFNMAVMGLRIAGRANGVSLLHGVVSRGMFAGLWAGFDADDVPITSITNGVHAPTWVSRQIRDLALSADNAGLLNEPQGWEAIAQASDERIWAVKRQLREVLIEDARKRLRESWLLRGASDAELQWIDGVLDPDILTIGFARRVPSYKRLTLMLRDKNRLRALLLDEKRPVQLVVAGKSHPADDGGKKLIQELVQFADEEGVRHRIVFLPNYDMAMATLLYPGCDVWLNNPIRPLEASGTSGMKAALNGALNLSILDGWWDEWFDGQNGWAIPTADGVEDPDHRDDLEAAALYDLIEKSVAPTFYENNAHGVPARWIGMVRHTLSTLGPKVLASRMVRDYVNTLYLPAAHAGRAANADNFALAREVAAWKSQVRTSWGTARVEHVEIQGVGDTVNLGTDVEIRAYVALGDLKPEDIIVQVVHGRVDSFDVIVNAQTPAMSVVEGYDGNRWLYSLKLNLAQNGPFGYTVRILPNHRGLASPQEMGLQILPVVAAEVHAGEKPVQFDK